MHSGVRSNLQNAMSGALRKAGYTLSDDGPFDAKLKARLAAARAKKDAEGKDDAKAKESSEAK